ncbi:tripartite tricarboxylate transporter TctB family protein [Sulfitobacter sp. HNIBRBA3233]|uniref:tripartite tricarboxylate transporter TctB family protein n=1 Tax=Sulfitobacter marinivivus TaxID=3158558 RepID=UPI0032DFC34D
MVRTQTLQDLFKRYRRPGDLLVAALSLAFALFLAVNLPGQTTWVARVQLFAQPAFWPTVAVAAMVLFSALHLIGALVSERIPGRWAEVGECLKAVEYVVWFMVYVLLVPWLGYLPSTIAFTLLLTYRLGYRGMRWSLAALALAVGVVVVFKSGLQVRIPSGALYELLPTGPLRTFVMTYL